MSKARHQPLRRAYRQAYLRMRGCINIGQAVTLERTSTSLKSPCTNGCSIDAEVRMFCRNVVPASRPTPIGELASIHSSKSDRRFSLISDPSRFGVRAFHSLLSKGAQESDFKQLGVMPVADAVTARATLAKQFMAYAVFNPPGLYTRWVWGSFFIWRPLWIPLISLRLIAMQVAPHPRSRSSKMSLWIVPSA